MKLTEENRSTWGKTCPSATLILDYFRSYIGNIGSKIYKATFEDLTALLPKIHIFWDVTPCRIVNKICALLGYYAALSGSSVPTIRDNLSVPSSRVKMSKKKALDFLILEDGTARLSRNVSKDLSLNAA
jgi:hypothetical protein